MEFGKAVEKRNSVRSFKDRKIDFRDIMYAVDAANKAPCAGGNYNMKFLIVEDAEKIKMIAKFADQHWIADAPVVVVACSDETHLEHMYGERGRIYCRQQAGAAIENFLLKLVDSGLSACWVGAFSDELIKQALKIPAHINIEALIPIGYEKPGRVKKAHKERPLENALFWDKWGEHNRPTLFKEAKMEELEYPA